MWDYDRYCGPSFNNVVTGNVFLIAFINNDIIPDEKLIISFWIIIQLDLLLY